MSVKLTILYDNLNEVEKEYIKNLFQDYLINPSLSKEILATNISSSTSLHTDRRGITKLMNYLQLPERNQNIVKESKKALGIAAKKAQADREFSVILKRIEQEFSSNEISKIYQQSSLVGLSNAIGVSVYYSNLILEHFKIDKKEIKNYKEIIEILLAQGFNKEKITTEYLDKNKTFADFKKTISKEIGYNISDTSMYRLLKHLNIVKPVDNIVYQQGKKSRSELIKNLEKLKKAGFESREDLAKYYEENKNLTKHKLVKQLNTKINENFFTLRWLGRHLDPFLSEDRLKGVSRVEREFQKELKNLLPETTIEFNDWKIIAPYQLDAYIPSLNVAIEFNGNYWHSDKFLIPNHNMTADEYHTMKSLMCKQKNIELLFVWEYDWYESSELIIKSLEKYFKTGKKPNILTKTVY